MVQPLMGNQTLLIAVLMVLMLIVGTALGLVTPPVGTVLNVVCGIAKVPMSGVIKGVMPFLIAQTIVPALLVIFPQIVMWPLYLMTR